ncbi:hypothetical protein [Rhizobium sp. GCM10022189]|uniref:hypothetical protein n=1 Tax=Rhizobium sp. GCM10022189 TaxID=3252654 RepID=UPI00361E515E
MIINTRTYRNIIERLIVSKVIDAILWAGFEVAVDDEERRRVLTATRDRSAIDAALFSGGRNRIYAIGRNREAWVEVAYGNGFGKDPISMYSGSMATLGLLKAADQTIAEIEDWIDRELGGCPADLASMRFPIETAYNDEFVRSAFEDCLRGSEMSTMVG